MKCRIVFLTVFFLLVSAAVEANENEKGLAPLDKRGDAVKLEDVVVISTRTEKEIGEAPGVVKVVTREDMERTPALTVDGAMKSLPGVFNRRVNLMDTLASITVGGIPGQSRTLILKDGVPLNSAYTGDANCPGLTVGGVQKIEVAQGPFSSLYGGHAMGGVVNIVTAMADKRELVLRSGYGTSWSRGESLDDLRMFYVSFGDRPTDKLRLMLSYGYKATGGYPKDEVVVSTKPTAGITGWQSTTSSQGAPRYLIGDRGDNTWWDDSMDFKVHYDPTDSSRLTIFLLRARYGYNYDEPHSYLRDARGEPVYAYGTGGSAVRESSFTSGKGHQDTVIYSVRYENEIGVTKNRFSASLNDQRENLYTTPNTSAPYATLSGQNGKVSSSPNQMYRVDFQTTFPLMKRHIVTAGGAFAEGRSTTEEHSIVYYKDEDTKTDLSYNSGGKQTSYALFLQDEILLTGRLTAYVGIRQDWWRTYDGYANQFGAGGFARVYQERSDGNLSPNGALVYKPWEETVFRASIGRAFRAPTLYELYRTWVSTSGVTYRGNPDLSPETVLSWNVAVTQGLGKDATVSATYFENYLRDLIYRKSISTTEQVYINAGRAQSKGFTLEARQRLGKRLKVFANFTYTDARIEENEAKPTTVGKRLTQLPDKMFNAGADLDIDRFSLSVTGRYVGKRYGDDENRDDINGVAGSYDPFFTADLRAAYEIAKGARFSLSVLNIGGESYYESYRAPGRLIIGELELRFP